MSKLKLSTIAGDTFYLIPITEEESLFIKQAFVNQAKDLHFIEGEDYIISDIVAWGDSSEVTEKEVARYIIAGKSKTGELRYECHKGIKEKFESHYDAISSWSCALEYLNFPQLVVLIRIKEIL